MDEEKMWKGFFDKLQDLKANPPTEHDTKLQDLDGGFFEKFGSLLQQKSIIAEDDLKTSLAPFEESDPEPVDSDVEEPDNVAIQYKTNQCVVVPPPEMDLETKSLDEEQILSRKEEFIEKNFGMNLEDLYEEILFEISNNIGSESNNICTDDLIEFAQEAFKISNDKHEEILEEAQRKEPPKIRLNVEIIKAENLIPKDSNGLSDPFVTLYLESSASHRYNSSVKIASLNPIWEEHFSLPISESPREEVLIIEVWDFDPAETVKDKVNKLFEVKGVKGLRKLVKEIALTASTGKHDNEFIGRASITLKTVPINGLTAWYNLEKKNKTKSRGSILVNMTLSAEKNKHVAIQEHRHLLKLLLIHELETSQVAHYWWSGKFTSKAEAIRSQHAVQSGLSSFDCALSQWSVYATIHEDHPLSFTLYNNILDVLTPVLKFHHNEGEDMKTFWDGAKRILPSCFQVIRKLRAKNCSDKQIVKTLCEVLDILAKITSLPVCETIELFPKNVYGWITERENQEGPITIDQVMIDAINTGTKEWMEQACDANRPTGDKQTDEDQLQFLMKIISMVRSDLQKAMEYFDKSFYHKVKLSYSTVLYKFYDLKLAELTKLIVVEVCTNIKHLNVPDEEFEYIPNVEEINMGTTLFELYLVLKRFLTLGQSLCPQQELYIDKFYSWFKPGVTHWLDISVVKALTRIGKAVELDPLKQVDDSVKYSSSAVDTLAIFYQIKIFWQQLDWPDIEGSYIFVTKIINDICRCCIFYAKQMSRRVMGTHMADSGEFNVSLDWCLAINNIDYIRQSLPAFIKELGTDEIIRKLGEYRTQLEADRCAMTIKTVIENSQDTQRNQILELAEIVARRMGPPIRRFLAEGAEVLHENSNSMEHLMLYLEDSLKTLYEVLNEVNFARILDAIWIELSAIMYELIQINLNKRRPPAFFHNLRETLHVMVDSFKMGKITTSVVEVLAEVERLLDLHSFETAELIHQYYLERLGLQKDCKSSDYGQLAIQAKFTDTGLILNILNARNLVAMDKNGASDSFVKVQFLPTNHFLGVTCPKTAVKHKTSFPLYDEQFTINLTTEQMSRHNSLILFSIKDKDLFGMSQQYIAECYITFADIMASEDEQIHMELSRPEYSDSDTIRALEHRLGDKQAKDFLKKLKTKSYT